MLPGRILFDDLFDDDIDVRRPQGMLCDIYEKDNTYHIDIDAPGFKKEDIKIECDKGNLKIIAERHSEDKESKKFLHRERKSYERCERSFYLGNVDEDKIQASFNDGILSITVPKEEVVETKKTISIN